MGNTDISIDAEEKDTSANMVHSEGKKKIILFLLLSIFLIVIYFWVWEIQYSIQDGAIVLVLSFVALIPAFLADALMPAVANFNKIKRFPIDGGRMHKDGQRILGDGKSWNGFILGTIFAFILSILIANLVYPLIYEQTMLNFSDGITGLEFITKENILGFIDIQNNKAKFYISSFLLALSAPVGDLIGSYYKRRRKVGHGDVFLWVDQNDFIVLGGLVAWIFFPFTWYYYVILLLITPVLTISFSFLGYIVGKKKVPW